MENDNYILNTPTKATLEVCIADFLRESPLYNERKSSDFVIDRMCDPEMLRRFIQEGQPEAWAKLVKRYGDGALDAVIGEYNHKIDRGEGMLKILREGFTLQGIKIKLLQFKPDQKKNEPFVALYNKNCFSVIRQFRYSNVKYDKGNELDLVILINGIPFITCELKNEASGQTIVNGMKQYREDRDKNNRLLKHCLVHFVVDDYRAMMTTKLRNEETSFLPFNIETNNPLVEGKYATHYLWEEIWQADSLLTILQHFIKQYIPKKSKTRETVTIFPRYHQLCCVRKILKDIKERETGGNYLVQHSAGSGKSMSIAWLAHQLVDLYDGKDEKYFDSVIVVTDRIILDDAISDEIENFATVAGVVKSVKKTGSKGLGGALDEEGSKIIVTTVQKFANVRKHLTELKGKRFAVIIDEAHSSQNGENAKEVKLTLTEKELLESIVEEQGEEILDDKDQLIAEIQAARQQMEHISFFAFTATPKKPTIALFGRNGEAFDVYSMRQAIEEKFILDVLDNYVTFRQMFELTGKEELSEEEQKLYEKKKAMRLMMQYVSDNPFVLSYKADMMMAHFMGKTVHKIGGQAKAMVVTNSRANAVRYKQIIDRIIAEKYNDEITTLVAFSGTVEINGQKFTEESMNGFGIKDANIREKFKDERCRILIVANKFQTGFDQNLLHTMFVDKQLGGVQAIQTLSRLNRCCDGKQDTMVIDFVNEPKNIQASFQDYYQTTRLSEPVDTQKLYDYKAEIDKYKVFSAEQLQKAVDVLIDTTQKAEGLSPLFRAIVQSNVEVMEKEEQGVFRKLIDRYVRQYSFLSQLMTFIDPELEKYYLFCKMLYKFLPYSKETLPVDILRRIDLDKFRAEEESNGSILLEKEDSELKGEGNGRVNAPKPGDLGTLQDLLREINEPYTGFLEENDKLIYSLLLEVLQEKDIQEAFKARNTVDVLIELVKKRFENKAYEKINEYVDLMAVMDSNQAFSETFFRKAFEFMAAATTNIDSPEYDEDALKQMMFVSLQQEFEELAGVSYRDMEEVLDWLFIIFNATTVESLDGLNEMLRNAFNNLYRADNREIDLHLYFQTLVTKYEAFLRKIYFMREGRELESTTPASGFIHVVQQFDDIQKLYKNQNPKLTQLSGYYNLLHQWRNDQAHQAPILNSKELSPALHAIAAMYVYAAMVSATDLEMGGN